MAINIKLTERDYIKYYKEYYLANKRAEKIGIGILVILFFASSVFNRYSWIGISFTVIIVGAVIFSILFTVPYTIAIMRFESTYNSFIHCDYIISMEANSINIHSPTENILYRKSNIKGIIVTDSYYGLLIFDKAFDKRPWRLLIPKSIATVQLSQVLIEQHYKTFSANNKHKAPYVWGLLSIVPIIGAINGLIMVIMGIFKYKSAAYVLLGAIGILFTAFICYVIVPDYNNKDFSKGIESTAQFELNDLVKNIEFYKLQNNHYPDSLKQLKTDNGMVSIYDPTIKNKTNVLFNYKRIGNKYTLFSAGMDEKPHTKDDIYPSVIITDSSKIGLIKVK